MNKIAPILTVVCLGLLLAFNWGLLPPLPPLQQAPAPSIAPVPPSPPVAVDPHPTPSASPAEAHDLFLTELELYVHKLINEHRATVGRKPLALRSAALPRAAGPTAPLRRPGPARPTNPRRPDSFCRQPHVGCHEEKAKDPEYLIHASPPRKRPEAAARPPKNGSRLGAKLRMNSDKITRLADPGD